MSNLSQFYPSTWSYNFQSIGLFSPTASTTYYMSAKVAVTVAGYNKIYIPRPCVLNRVYVILVIVGSTSESRTSTISVRVNNTTDTTVTSSINCNVAVSNYNNTAMGVTLGANDYIELKWVTPAWIAAPTNVMFNGSYHFTNL